MGFHGILWDFMRFHEMFIRCLANNGDLTKLRDTKRGEMPSGKPFANWKPLETK